MIITVCEDCVKFGEEIKPPEITRMRKQLPKIEETEEILKPNFNEIIRNSRERMKLKQGDFAKKLNEKISVIKRIEDGWEPTPNLMSKIEKFFNIKLTGKPEEKISEKKTDKKKLTVGDVVEIH